MASKQSEARARVSLDPAPFEKGAKAIISAANSMSSTLTKTFAVAGGLMLAAFGMKTVAGLANTVKEVIQFGEQMANAGKRAGIAAGQFYLFNSAMEKGIGMKTAASLLGKNAEVLTRSAAVFRDVSIKLWVIGEKIRGFWLGLMERVAPVLSRFLDGGLGDALLDAGNTFGGAIANGIATVYQLAKDGKLWDTFKQGFKLAFDYAGERLKWLSQIGLGVLKEVFSLAFVNGMLNGIAAVQSQITDFCLDFGEQLEDAFETAWKKFKKLANNSASSVSVGAGAATGPLAAIPALLALLNGPTVSKAIDTKTPRTPRTPRGRENEGDVFKRISAIFGTQFKPSEDLAKTITDFTGGITATFQKYQREEKAQPTKTFENNTRRVSSGVDSLAAIGAGGNVYMGLTVLDVQKSQLKELQRINERLGALGTNSSLTVNNLSTGSLGVSRTQTSSPVTTPGR